MCDTVGIYLLSLDLGLLRRLVSSKCHLSYSSELLKVRILHKVI